MFSKTGLSLYFGSDRPGGFGGLDIWVSQRASLDDPWGTPQNLGPRINGPDADHCALLPSDEHTLIFASTRPGGLGANDLYISKRRNPRDDFSWDIPENLGPNLNSPADDYTPGWLDDEVTSTNTLYFGSTRPGGMGAIDIYTSVLRND